MAETVPDPRTAVPSPPRDLVVRQRLLDAVSLGVQGPLTLVSAPAGTGKTTLLTSWHRLARSVWPLVWVSLEPGDERPAVFWSRLLDAVRDAGLDVACSGRSTTGPADEAAHVVERLATCVRGAGTPVVLVLDGADRLVEPWGGDELTELLRAFGPALRLVVVCRSDPALPLHLYRLAGTVLEIRAEELAFTEGEAAELLHGRWSAASPAQVAAINGRCRGWAAGVRFAAIGLVHDGAEQVVRELSRDGGDVCRYLRSEVLDTHSPVMRDVLLRSSVADRLDPGLLEELTGAPHGEKVLDQLVHGNALVERLPRGGGYRYQPLFAEFLRARLAEEQPGAVRELHLVAAAWAVRQGALLDAARHSAAVGAWSDAAGHLVDDLAIGALLAGPDSARLLRLFTNLPEDAPGSAAAVVRATLQLAVGDLQRCGTEVDRASQALAEEPDQRRSCGELAVAVVQLLLAERRGDVESALARVVEAEGLLEAAPRDAVFAHPELLALVSGCRGRMLVRRGDLMGARTALAASARLAEQARSDALLVEALGVGALAEAVNGRLRRALDLSHRALAAAHDAGIDRGKGIAAAATALAWVRMEQYDVGSVGALADEASTLITRADAPLTAAALALVRARYERATGDLDAACAELHALGHGQDPAAWLSAPAAAAEAGVLAAMGRTRPLPAPVLPAVEPAGTTPLDVRLADLLARADQALLTQRPGQAAQLLERALRQAAPEHMRRPFFEAGPRLLRFVGPGSELAARHPWLGDTRRTVAGNGPQTGAAGRDHDQPPRACADGTVLVEPLTPKEREVLGHLAQLLTTEEIAATMFVSVNTVRTHVRSVLRKLSASRRNEAVRRAWELQLLPPRTEVPRQSRRAPA